MDTTSDIEQTPRSGDRTNVIVSSQALAAIRQLTETEQAAILAAAHQAIAEHGLASAPGIRATLVDGTEQVYLLHMDATPDLRMIAQQLNSTMVEIIDVARAETIHNLAHAS